MKTFTGKVIAKKMLKTATVAVERVVTHPVYGKKFRRVKKYHVHDEMETQVGDTVWFVPSRPYSRIKKWKIVKILGKDSEVKKNSPKEKKVKKEAEK
jgi:small subunit ribosomal protein S17